MKINNINKKRNRANFSADLSNADPSIKWGRIPFEWREDWYSIRGRAVPLYARLNSAKTLAKHVAVYVEMIEERIATEGKFPNWSVRGYLKDRAWKRAVRIVNAKKRKVK